MQQCREIRLEEWKQRSQWRRFADSFMRLFAPLM
jgi:hypothetical protein